MCFKKLFYIVFVRHTLVRHITLRFLNLRGYNLSKLSNKSEATEWIDSIVFFTNIYSKMIQVIV